MLSQPASDLRLVCAWCSRVKLARWLPERVARRLLGLGPGDELGRVSHGICEECFARAVGEVAAAA